MRIIVRMSDNVVAMYSRDGKPEPNNTQKAYDLDDAQAAAFDAIMNQPNGGVVYDGTIFLAVPPLPLPPVIAKCTPWQFRKQMRIMNIKAEVEALIAQQDEETREAYDFATEVESDNPLLLSLAAQLTVPLSEQQVYDMIASASTLKIGG